MASRPHAKASGQTTQPSGSKVPKGWPSSIVYLHSQSYSKKLSKNVLNKLIIPKPNIPSNEIYISKGPYSNVKITAITDKTHPAFGQCGLFAAQHLPPESLVLPYLGLVHDDSDVDETSDYDLSLDRELGNLGVDATHQGNESRFCNDFRGIGPTFNAEFRDAWFDMGNGKVERRIGIFVLPAGKSGKRAKGIEKGQEILINYGKGFWAHRKGEE